MAGAAFAALTLFCAPSLAQNYQWLENNSLIIVLPTSATYTSSNGVGASGWVYYKSQAAGTNWITKEFHNANQVDISDICSSGFMLSVNVPAATTLAAGGGNPPTNTNTVCMISLSWFGTDLSHLQDFVFPAASQKLWLVQGQHPETFTAEYVLSMYHDLWQSNMAIIGTISSPFVSPTFWQPYQLPEILEGPGNPVPGVNFGHPIEHGTNGAVQMSVIVPPEQEFFLHHTVNGVTTITTNVADEFGLLMLTLYPTNESEFFRVMMTNSVPFPIYSSYVAPTNYNTNIWNCTNCPHP